MISHELSTIQQHDRLQEWLQSCPGYVEPDLEGLNSTFRVAYLPLRSPGKRERRKPSYSAELTAIEAAMAEKIRSLAERNMGITAICAELCADTRRVRRVAALYRITIPVKRAFRKEGEE